MRRGPRKRIVVRIHIEHDLVVALDVYLPVHLDANEEIPLVIGDPEPAEVGRPRIGVPAWIDRGRFDTVPVGELAIDDYPCGFGAYK